MRHYLYLRSFWGSSEHPEESPRGLCAVLHHRIPPWHLPSSSPPVPSCSGLCFSQLLPLASTSLPSLHCLKLKGFPLKEEEISILLLFQLLFYFMLCCYFSWWKFLAQQVEFEWSHFNAGNTLVPPVSR